MRTWTSAACRSKVSAMRHCPRRFRHCIFVSTRLRRWSPLHRRQRARPRYLAARRASFRASAPAVTVFHGLAFLRGRITAWADRIVALAHVIGAIHCPAGDCNAICREGAVTRPVSWSSGIWSRRPGRIGASPMCLPVISTARISSASSSIPRWSLRQTRRLGPPVARQHMLACARGMLARVPLPFALDLDPGAVDQQVQRAFPRDRSRTGSGDIMQFGGLLLFSSK